MSQDGSSELLTTVSTLVEKLTAGWGTRMDSVERKLDSLLDKISTVGTVSQTATDAKSLADQAHQRLNAVELAQAEHKGRLAILTGLFVCVGAPVLVMLVAAGIAKLFGIQIGGL